MDLDGADEIFHKHSAFSGRGGGPERVDVETGEQSGDFFEALGEFVSLTAGGVFSFRLVSQRSQLGGELGVLGAKGLGIDVFVVVESEQLLAFALERADGGGSIVSRLWAFVAGELSADGVLELVVIGDKSKAEVGGTVETLSGSAGLGAALAPVFAAVDGVSSVVVLNRDHTPTETAAHFAGQEITSSAAPGGVRSLSGRPFGDGDERLVFAREPLISEAHFAEVHPFAEDFSNGGVADPDGGFDGVVAGAFSP